MEIPHGLRMRQRFRKRRMAPSVQVRSKSFSRLLLRYKNGALEGEAMSISSVSNAKKHVSLFHFQRKIPWSIELWFMPNSRK